MSSDVLLRKQLIRLAHANVNLRPQILQILACSCDESSAPETDMLARFEEGVSADPTENMNPADAAEWKKNTETYGDKFKQAAASKPDLAKIQKVRGVVSAKMSGGKIIVVVPDDIGNMSGKALSSAINEILGWDSWEYDDSGFYPNQDDIPKGKKNHYVFTRKVGKQARHEEGVSVDPTENMSPADKKKWEGMNEQYGDKFKTAAMKFAGNPKGEISYAMAVMLMQIEKVLGIQKMIEAYNGIQGVGRPTLLKEIQHILVDTVSDISSDVKFGINPSKPNPASLYQRSPTRRYVPHPPRLSMEAAAWWTDMSTSNQFMIARSVMANKADAYAQIDPEDGMSLYASSQSDANLRKQIIRLAHSHEALRPHLLNVLAETAPSDKE